MPPPAHKIRLLPLPVDKYRDFSKYVKLLSPRATRLFVNYYLVLRNLEEFRQD